MPELLPPLWGETSPWTYLQQELGRAAAETEHQSALYKVEGVPF